MSAPLPTPGFDFDTWSPGVGMRTGHREGYVRSKPRPVSDDTCSYNPSVRQQVTSLYVLLRNRLVAEVQRQLGVVAETAEAVTGRQRPLDADQAVEHPRRQWPTRVRQPQRVDPRIHANAFTHSGARRFEPGVPDAEATPQSCYLGLNDDPGAWPRHTPPRSERLGPVLEAGRPGPLGDVRTRHAEAACRTTCTWVFNG